MNLDDNMMIKARSLFELLPGEASALRQCFLTLIRRIVNLYVLLKVRCSQIGTNCWRLYSPRLPTIWFL